MPPTCCYRRPRHTSRSDSNASSSPPGRDSTQSALLALSREAGAPREARGGWLAQQIEEYKRNTGVESK